ncbi:hypothetical protein GMDG_07067 [Pseudogymnoascus destructans 20631-21]|uniref:Uncharacterized protein n=1 Tax=Pseudogymnoascus destructans (strain ATCC MYA-4855 / 20631-21) TaxID=658429 RepID=L8FVD3_PSED2|nr:hypothetical protein GMDG_07067 [Pseudogymnoascus destructans 20631-21]
MLTRRTALLTALLLASTFVLFLNAGSLSRYARSPLAVPLAPGQEGEWDRPQLPGGQGGAVVNPDGGAVAKEGDKDGGLGRLNGDAKNGGLGGFGGENKDAGLGGLNGDGGFGGDNKSGGLVGFGGGNKDGGLDGFGGDNKNAGLGGLDGNSQSKEAGNTAPIEFPPSHTNTNTNTNTAPPAILPETTNTNPFPAPTNADGSPKHTYFEQAFSASPPFPYDFPALKAQCARTHWRSDDVYLQCGGMAAGLTSIMSQVKVCLKMAFEAGTGLVLPSMPLRDSDHLQEFNLMNQDAYMTYDQWFDVGHLIDSVTRVCPQMKIVHPAQLDTVEFPVKHKWHIKLEDAKGYRQFLSYFWAGRPFATFFNEQYTKLTQLDTLNPHNKAVEAGAPAPKGMTLVRMSSNFLLFRITDDPTGQDLKLWNDLGHLIRFTQPTRDLVAALLGHVPRPFYGVHFRVESDTIWSSLENQLKVDLDALDKAWEMFGTPGGEKPLVYLACGDQEQVAKFVEAGKARGWEVTHKWTLAGRDKPTLEKIDALPFDFQGAVDMGFMVKSEFFLGITGSAFSSTIGNARDVTGRYRGSSLLLGKGGDGGGGDAFV